MCPFYERDDILSTIIVDCVNRKFVLSHFRENGLENVITLVKGKAEAVTLPVDKVNFKTIESATVTCSSCFPQHKLGSVQKPVKLRKTKQPKGINPSRTRQQKVENREKMPQVFTPSIDQK